MTIPLDPMIALGVFFTSSSPSSSNHPFKDDPTIQYPASFMEKLVSVSSFQTQQPYPSSQMGTLEKHPYASMGIVIDLVFLGVCRYMEVHTSSLFQQQSETVNKNRPSKLIDLQHIKYDRLKTLANLLEQSVFEETINDAKSKTLLTIKRKYKDSFTSPAPASSTASKVDKNNDTYKAAMEFVVEFKQKRRMDWIACLKVGEDLNYKNLELLRQIYERKCRTNKVKFKLNKQL